MKTIIQAVLASGLLLGTDPTDDAKSDWKKLQGEWTGSGLWLFTYKRAK
jgi:hypothetical protein